MATLLDTRLDPYDKCVYLYMKFRYQFFKSLGLEYNESNKTIAEAVSISKRKVVSSINKMADLGIVIRVVGDGMEPDTLTGKTNTYVVIDEYTYQQRDKEDILPF